MSDNTLWPIIDTVPYGRRCNTLVAVGVVRPANINFFTVCAVSGNV